MRFLYVDISQILHKSYAIFRNCLEEMQTHIFVFPWLLYVHVCLTDESILSNQLQI